MNKICIYAICKNEIKYVDKWLDSMSEADYIVVLDTGSTDGTYKRLKEDPRVTKVVRKPIKPWRFDVARNESMKLVPDDANILFSTDLDEWLEPGWAQIIRDNWTEHTIRGHYRYVWSHTSSGAPGLTFDYDKMHTRDFKWWFPVHEVLGGLYSLTEHQNEELNGGRINFGDAIVLHHYPDETKSRKSYLDLLKLRYEENPGEAYSAYLLAREYGVNEDYDKALELFDRTLDLPDIEEKPLIKYSALGYMGDIYRHNKDIVTALTCYNSQLLADATYREPYLNIAEIYNELGLYKTSLGFVEDALTKTHQHFNWAERSEAWNEQPYDILSVAYYYLDEVDKGIENALRALQANPTSQRIQKNYLALIDKKKSMNK